MTDYNTVISNLNTQFTYTSGSGEGVLATDSAVRNLQSEVLGALGYTLHAGVRHHNRIRISPRWASL